MSFASLKKASSAGNTFARLTKEIEKLSILLQAVALMSVSGNQNWTSLVTVMQSFDSFLHPMAKICLGRRSGVMLSRVLADSGTLKILSPLIGKDDPVGELNRELWNSGRDSDKEIARAQKRKTLLLLEHLCCE